VVYILGCGLWWNREDKTPKKRIAPLARILIPILVNLCVICQKLKNNCCLWNPGELTLFPYGSAVFSPVLPSVKSYRSCPYMSPSWGLFSRSFVNVVRVDL
jgi:hypothetical protein